MKPILIHTLLFIISAICLCSTASVVTESQALLKWKASLDFQSLTSWSSSSSNSPCKWTGVICDSSGSVVQINLPNSNFSGTLDELNFASLPNLTRLDLNFNNLHGSIPSNLSLLSKLNLLDLANNNFTGAIPPKLGRLSELLDLRLYNNYLTNAVPYQLSNLNDIRIDFYQLGNNRLYGEIPSSLRNCSLLEILDLGQNALTGNIPTWIGESLKSLKVLHLRSNMFFGNIPPHLSSLNFLKLLDLAQNNLSGMIPKNLGNLCAMAELRNQSRKISPTDPELRLKVRGVVYQYYNPYFAVNVVWKKRVFNYKTIYSIPTSIDLSSNSLSGYIPEELTTLYKLPELNLSGNTLTGTIPYEIGSLSDLESLDLSLNNLSGSIPPSISSLNFLDCLNLSFNNLSGKIRPGNQLQTLVDSSIYMGNPV